MANASDAETRPKPDRISDRDTTASDRSASAELQPSSVTPSLTQRRHVVWIVAVASLPLIVLVVLGIVQGMGLAQDRVAEERVALAQAAAVTAAAFVEGSLSTAQSLALTSEVRQASSTPELEALLPAVLAVNREWEGWGLAGPDGWNIASTGAAPGTLNVADRPYFQEALRTGQATISPAVLNRRTGQPTVAMAVPVNFENGQRGAIIVSLSTARLASEIQALRQDNSIRITLVDSEGTVFAAPEAGTASDLPSLRGRPAVDAALRGDTGSLISTGSGGEEALIAYAPVRQVGWAVIVNQPTSAAFDVVRRQTTLGAIVLVLAVILAGVISWRLGGRLADLYHRQLLATARAEASARSLERVSAESEQRRQFLEGVIASAPVAIAILRGDTYRHEAFNAQYEALQPGTPLAGRTIDEVFPAETAQAMRATFDRVAETGEEEVRGDQAWLLADGDGQTSHRYFTHVAACLGDVTGRSDALLSIILETTDVVLARRRTDREKDELLSTASHELKTPLTSLGLAAQMIDRMMDRGQVDEARLARHLGTIRAQVERVTRLIGRLLDVSRIETGRLGLSWEPVDLVLLARLAVVRERDALPEGSNHQIVLRPASASIIVEGDEARIEQVITNLLSNAVKYSPSGGLVDVVIESEGDVATVDVVDRGIGVPEEERERLFAPFSRTATAVDAGVEGTGLGLYISRKIVEAHDGTIEMIETPGGGSTFRVTLPVRRTTATPDDLGEATRPSDAA